MCGQLRHRKRKVRQLHSSLPRAEIEAFWSPARALHTLLRDCQLDPFLQTSRMLVPITSQLKSKGTSLISRCSSIVCPLGKVSSVVDLVDLTFFFLGVENSPSEGELPHFVNLPWPLLDAGAAFGRRCMSMYVHSCQCLPKCDLPPNPKRAPVAPYFGPQAAHWFTRPFFGGPRFFLTDSAFLFFSPSFLPSNRKRFTFWGKSGPCKPLPGPRSGRPRTFFSAGRRIP